jgi:hypothetical protein
LARNPGRVGFSRTEAFLALKDRKDVKTSEALAPAFRLLVDHNYIRPLDRPENVRPGPVPECYAVNAVWDRCSANSVPTVPTVKQPTNNSRSNCSDSRDEFLENPCAGEVGDMEEFAP